MDDDVFSFDLFSVEEIDSNISLLSTPSLIDPIQAKRDQIFESVNVPLYTAESAFELLEAKMPHIYKLIKIAQPAGLEHRIIDRLLMDSRNGKREGFSKEIYTALLFLHTQLADTKL